MSQMPSAFTEDDEQASSALGGAKRLKFGSHTGDSQDNAGDKGPDQKLDSGGGVASTVTCEMDLFDLRRELSRLNWWLQLKNVCVLERDLVSIAMNYFVVNGLYAPAVMLAEEANFIPDIPLQSIRLRYYVQQAILEEDVDKVMKLLSSTRPSILAMNPDIHFRLREQQFLKLILEKKGDEETLNFAQHVLAPCAEYNPDLIIRLEEAMTSLAFPELNPLILTPDTARKATKKLAKEIDEALLNLYGVSKEPVVHSILKTLAWAEEHLTCQVPSATMGPPSLVFPSLGGLMFLLPYRKQHESFRIPASQTISSADYTLSAGLSTDTCTTGLNASARRNTRSRARSSTGSRNAQRGLLYHSFCEDINDDEEDPERQLPSNTSPSSDSSTNDSVPDASSSHNTANIVFNMAPRIQARARRSGIGGRQRELPFIGEHNENETSYVLEGSPTGDETDPQQDDTSSSSSSEESEGVISTSRASSSGSSESFSSSSSGSSEAGTHIRLQWSHTSR